MYVGGGNVYLSIFCLKSYKQTYCSNNNSHTLFSESIKNRKGIDRLKGLCPLYHSVQHYMATLHENKERESA